MQKNSYYPGYEINFLQKGIILSPPVLLVLPVYSNPVGEKTRRKADYNFLSGKPVLTSLRSLFQKQATGGSLKCSTNCSVFLHTKFEHGKCIGGYGRKRELFNFCPEVPNAPCRLRQMRNGLPQLLTKYRRMIHDFSLLLTCCWGYNLVRTMFLNTLAIIGFCEIKIHTVCGSYGKLNSCLV